MNEQPPTLPQTPNASKIPKVLGIIHIVIAVIGIASGVFPMTQAGYQTSKNRSLHHMVTDQFNFDKNKAEYAATREALDKVTRAHDAQSLMLIVLGLLLLVAGIMLLKKKMLGVKLTNLWAAARIAAAIVIYFLTVGAYADFWPAFEKLVQANTGSSLPVGAISQTSLVLGLIPGMVYPIICLILLKKASAKAELT